MFDLLMSEYCYYCTKDISNQEVHPMSVGYSVCVECMQLHADDIESITRKKNRDFITHVAGKIK